MLCTTDLFAPAFYTHRWFGMLVHAAFFFTLVLILYFGRTPLNRFKFVAVATFSVFVLSIYFLNLWPSIIAAFVRAPWASENESGPVMSAPSDYALYAWEWEAGPRGVKE